MNVIKRRTRYALEEMKNEDCELHMHNVYMLEDFKDKLDVLDEWLNGVDEKFDQDNTVHMNALADIVMCYDKLESVCERLQIV
tara:strand:- start:57 stop:305 length:249 start_codon:yes stop_codon:yes gene_type:complete